MALPVVKTPNDFPFKHSGQTDQYGQSLGGDFAQVQTNFDSRAEYNQTQINAIITALASVTLGDDGAKQIGLKLNEITATDVNGAILELYNTIIGIVLDPLVIPDNSLTNAKLASDVKVGSLAALTTTVKTDVVNAINEIVANYLLKSGGLIKNYTEETTVIASATGTVNLDFSLGNVFDITLSGATTLTFSNIPSAESHSATLIVRQISITA